MYEARVGERERERERVREGQEGSKKEGGREEDGKRLWRF